MLLKKIALGICCSTFFCLGYFCSPLVSFADTVVLKTGQVVEGRIIENTAKYVKIDFDGVELTYFQEEIASVNQGKADNLASKELTSLYEAYESGKKVIENKKLSAVRVEPTQPTVNQETQDAQVTGDVSATLLPQTAEGINSSAAIQAALSQLPKEYQEVVKSRLQNMQGSSSVGQTPGAAPADLSSLPPEYQNMIKSSLEKLQPNTQAAKN